MIGAISACSSTPRETDAQGDAYFHRDSLGYIADQFNRANKIQIRVLGARAAQRLYVGRLNLNEPITFALLLRRDRTLCVEEKGDTILVRTRDFAAARFCGKLTR
jgi:ferric-dicitrate binding protein FerR (iron transport regulator)